MGYSFLINPVNKILRNKKLMLLLGFRTGGMALVFVLNLIVSRLYGAEGVGLYYIYLSMAGGLALLAGFGGEKAIIRIAALYSDKGQPNMVKGVWYRFFVMSLFFATLLAFLFISAKEFALNLVLSDSDNTDMIYYVAASFIMLTVISLNYGIYRGLKKPIVAAFIENIILPTSTIIALLLFGARQDAIIVVEGRLIAISVVFLITSILVVRELKHLGVGYINYKYILNESWPIFGVSIISYLTQWSATFIIAYYLNESEVGIYNIAWRLVLLVAMVNYIFNNLNSPFFAADFESRRMEMLENRVRKTAAASSLAGLLFLLPLCVFSQQVLLFFGPDFANGVPVLIILALGQFVSMSCGSVGYLLMMTGHGYLQRNINLLVLLLLYILLPYFVDHYGIIGAAVISSMAIAFNNITLSFIAYTTLNIKVWPDYKGLLR